MTEEFVENLKKADIVLKQEGIIEIRIAYKTKSEYWQKIRDSNNSKVFESLKKRILKEFFANFPALPDYVFKNLVE